MLEWILCINSIRKLGLEANKRICSYFTWHSSQKSWPMLELTLIWIYWHTTLTVPSFFRARKTSMATPISNRKQSFEPKMPVSVRHFNKQPMSLRDFHASNLQVLLDVHLRTTSSWKYLSMGIPGFLQRHSDCLVQKNFHKKQENVSLMSRHVQQPC